MISRPLTSTRVISSSLRASRFPVARTSTSFINTNNHRAFSRSAINMSTVSDEIKEDHRDLEQNYSNIINATDDDTRERWQNQFIWELARHSHGEELVVYPAFEKYLGPSGKEMADKDRAEHLTLKKDLAHFQKLKPNHPDFRPTLDNLMNDLRQHIKEEENHDLPKLEQALSTDDSIKMSKTFSRMKAFVPTRSHPSAPDKPPFETAIGLLTAPIDHIRDVFAKFPDHSINPNPSTK